MHVDGAGQNSFAYISVTTTTSLFFVVDRSLARARVVASYSQVATALRFLVHFFRVPLPYTPSVPLLPLKKRERDYHSRVHTGQTLY